MTKITNELDEFVMDEAIRLRILRKKMTGILWSIDHTIPLKHAQACGLHNAFNLQVVPLQWNVLKQHRGMDSYWPIKPLDGSD